jgi:hypothetical protein
LIGVFAFFLVARVGDTSPRILTGIGLVTLIASLIAGGFASIKRLLVPGNESVDTNQSESWVVRAKAPLEESWNRWSDAVVILGLGIAGIGSFVLLTTDPSDGASLGLLFVGFICGGAALFSLALLAE